MHVAHRRHRWAAERRQIDTLQCADAYAATRSSPTCRASRVTGNTVTPAPRREPCVLIDTGGLIEHPQGLEAQIARVRPSAPSRKPTR